jgi:peptidoglycan/LPS O-acetylase OafA/YrhL
MIGTRLETTEGAVSSPPNRKIPSLDGWRAIAISTVLASHMWASEGSPLHGPIWHFLSNQGNLGVRIFFTLSGFLITFLLLKEKEQTGKIDLRAFYLRRIFRIFPIYFLYIGFLAVCQLLGIYHDAGSTWFGALTFTRNLIGQGDSATGHLWSLAVEEQFYVAWPSILVLAGLPNRLRVTWIMLGAIIFAAIVARSFECHGSGFFCRFVLHPNSALRYSDCLSIGCIGAFIYAKNWQTSETKSRIIAPIASILLVASTMIPPKFGSFGASVVLDAQSWLAIVAIICSANAGGGMWFKFLNAKPVVFLGLISYSLYIWHMIFLREYAGVAFPLGLFGNWSIWWIAAIVVATLSFYWFEKPIIEIGKRWRR